MKSVPLLSLAVSSLVLLSTGTMAEGHPGVGIVRDSRGNVFFTDLRQVWKITPDDKYVCCCSRRSCARALPRRRRQPFRRASLGGRGRMAPPGLVPEAHRIIERRRLVARRFPTGLRLCADRAGNMYWADRGEKMAIKKRSPEGTVTTHAIADFRALQWMTATADGVLFLMDGGDLRRVSPDGHVTTVVTSLSEHEPPPAGASDRNYHMGMWTDKEGFVYVAVARERLVLRVQADGKKKVDRDGRVTPGRLQAGCSTATTTCGCWSITRRTRFAQCAPTEKAANACFPQTCRAIRAAPNRTRPVHSRGSHCPNLCRT